ncbi:hypothetical protein AMJ52_08350 [candidate division TA06 bacterium DG_78]|uniref:Uncharacterized protein n=1 Tax=candidate division TA06 bacterium DG_78 TaxID=1703772 RepID=A0A0S7YAB6_UNCT6|nr:MAG: hypothetical protein AMJ52_08350 [candidate division TA06 bacterium DG_78]
MNIDSFLNILLTLYSCFLILALVKRTCIYSRLNLRRIRNLLFLLEGFFILAVLAVVKLHYIGLGSILFAVIFGSAVAIGDFVVKLKKNLKDGVHIPYWADKLDKICRRFRVITIIVIIVIGILCPFVYPIFFEGKYSYQEYGNIIMSFLSLFALSGTTLYFLLIILLERKYGPIYYNQDKNGGS